MAKSTKPTQVSIVLSQKLNYYLGRFLRAFSGYWRADWESSRSTCHEIGENRESRESFCRGNSQNDLFPLTSRFCISFFLLVYIDFRKRG